jgi:hypothetical protein
MVISFLNVLGFYGMLLKTNAGEIFGVASVRFLRLSHAGQNILPDSFEARQSSDNPKGLNAG